MEAERSAPKRLKQLPALFRKQDAEKVAPHTAMFLTRAVKKELIYRIIRGHYVNSFLYGFPSVEEVACFLRPPAYVTCEWAMNYHGVSLQVPATCTVATLSTAVGRNRNIAYQGVTIAFSRISPALFTGFAAVDKFYVATPEKALLDTLYYRKRIPAHDELEWDEVDAGALAELAAKYPKSVSRALFRLPGYKGLMERWMNKIGLSAMKPNRKKLL